MDGPYKNIKDIFRRTFTKELENSPEKSVYDLFEWKKVDVLLKHFKTGETIFEMKDLEFPKGYSQNACDIIASKYFRKSGVPNKEGHEKSLKEVVDRMATFWADALEEEGIIENKEQWQIFYDEIVYGLLSQMWAPNSPQWFNTGLEKKYGLKGEPDDLYYYDEKTESVKKSEDRYTRSQTSACFILSVVDQLLGDHSITDHYVSETKLFKGGSGVGTNFSALRAEGERLSSGGQSSGLMSFLLGLDRNAGAIKSGGTTRRAAKMVIVDVDHPEIESFINWKAREEDKVRALAKMGYDASMEGEAYQTVSGQNSNNSVRVNSDFMKDVLNLDKDSDVEFTLKGRVDDTINKKVKVADIWDQINRCAWECADPGLQFDDIYNAWHTCPGGLDGDTSNPANRINATNPCSEYAFLDDTACNLASINIYKFLEPATRKINIEYFSHLAGLILLVLEASIYYGQFPTKDVAERSYLFRTCGIGMANYASLFLALGYPYDSKEARNLAASLTGIMTGHCYFISAMMAKQSGPFKKYDVNKDYMARVIRNHARVAGALNDAYENLGYTPLEIDHDLLKKMGYENISLRLKDAWQEAIEYGKEYGYHNAQVSVIAPTGTISFAMDCGATSIEPFYSHIAYKKLVGGGSMEIINPVLEEALLNLGYSAEETKDIVEYVLAKDEDGMLLHFGLEGAPHLKKEDYKIFETANQIRPEGHVLMVAAVTPMISGSISKTVNLPSYATIEDVKNINLLAYQSGVKAIAIYRDGCKAMQPLSTGQAVQEGKAKLEDLSYNELLNYAKSERSANPERRRPEGIRASHTHSAKIGDIELYITVGFYSNGDMAEIFVSTDKDGTVVKGLLANISKAVSHMLQYGIAPQSISQMMRGQRYEPSGVVERHPFIKMASSISDLLSKVIDIECNDFSRCQVKPEDLDYEPIASQMMFMNEAAQTEASEDDFERIYGEICSNCGSDNLVRNGTCKVCIDCGSTTGCS